MSKLASTAFALIGSLLLAGAANAAAPQAASATLPAPTVLRAVDMQMVVSHPFAHLRKSPNTKSTILATLKKGTKVDVIEKVAGGKWAHVKANNTDGYVAVSLLK